jgi:hypothetical protein
MRRALWPLFILVTFSYSLHAAYYQGSILGVTRKLKMTANEPLPPKDYFIDLGARQGIKPGQVFDVYRTIPVVDSWSGQPKEFLRVALGQLEVSYVGDSSSVARLTEQTDIKDLPAMDNPWFMVGDGVESNTSLPFQP